MQPQEVCKGVATERSSKVVKVKRADVLIVLFSRGKVVVLL